MQREKSTWLKQARQLLGEFCRKSSAPRWIWPYSASACFSCTKSSAETNSRTSRKRKNRCRKWKREILPLRSWSHMTALRIRGSSWLSTGRCLTWPGERSFTGQVTFPRLSFNETVMATLPPPPSCNYKGNVVIDHAFIESVSLGWNAVIRRPKMFTLIIGKSYFCKRERHAPQVSPWTISQVPQPLTEDRLWTQLCYSDVTDPKGAYLILEFSCRIFFLCVK